MQAARSVQPATVRMTAAVFVLGLLSIASSALGQGQFFFNNRNLPDVNAQFISDTGFVFGSNGVAYTVQLFGGTAGSPESTWTQLATTTFRTGLAAGYVNPIDVYIPGVIFAADFVIRIYEGTTTTGAPFKHFAGSDEVVFTTPLATGTTPPPLMLLGFAPIVFSLNPVPEPSPILLMGCALLWGAVVTSYRRTPWGRSA
jgi:hypothetical protein